ncbi:MAG: T9SS type A sorting domain-containing protein [Chitinophagales bacterium]
MKNVSFLVSFLSFASLVHAQTTWEKVYNLMQDNCASCHISGHESGLVLDGSMSEVYDNIYYEPAINETAAAKNYNIVMPGDPYKSFLFSKINNELAIDVNLSTGEGEPCPQDAAPMEDKEIELIRQWILYGAKEDGDAVDEELINTFYEEGGIYSITSPPAAPAESEGFQIHYGPYFLWPEDENEYWSKFATDLPDDIEIKKLDVVMGSYSHHFIIYKYDFATYFSNPFGLRDDDPEFLGVSLVTANQFSTELELPEKTAFKWSDNTWLDLNSHYINYSSDMPLACEVYVNVYTQPVGTALYEMFSDLPANTDIYIPNDNTFYTFEHVINDPGNNDEIFVWALTSHAHKYSSDFDMYLRNSDGTRGEHIFDASCGATNGIPGCADEIYDYQHPPIRYWDTFLPIIPKNGLLAEAVYINDGPEPVWFGLTSDDEMMVEIYFYIEDTVGLDLPPAVAIPSLPESDFKIYPNPVHDVFYVQLNEISGFASNNISVEILDMNSRIQYKSSAAMTNSSTFYMNRNTLPAGMYLLKLYDDAGNILTGKIVFE